MWRERTVSVGKNLGDLRSQRPTAPDKSWVDHTEIFMCNKVMDAPSWVLGTQNYMRLSLLILLHFLPLNLIMQQ